MRCAVILGGVVVQVIEAVTVADARNLLGAEATVVGAGDAGIGWTWDGLDLSPPAPVEAAARPSVAVTSMEVTLPGGALDADAVVSPSTHQVIAAVGSTVTVTAELRDAGGALFPLDTLAVIPATSGAVTHYLRGDVTGGVVTIAVALEASGRWTISGPAVGHALGMEVDMPTLTITTTR